MKQIIYFVLAIASVATSSGANAQDQAHEGQTREAVYKEMAAYKAAGFDPARQNPRTWVDDLQAATEKVHAQESLAKSDAPARNTDSNSSN
jgi:hypothetical protein